ncbi:MAG: DnaJ domain-containing protein [Thermodesulfobacteriota bacterium]
MKFIAVLLIIIALLYIISPYDFIPDFFPVTGWFDDAFLLGILLYYLKFRRLPGFLAWLMRFGTRSNPRNRAQTAGHSDTKNNGPKSDAGDPYQILGLKSGAGPDEIRTAYRQAAQAYHPDKVAHLGPELRELAQKKFVEIQRAYDALMDKRK